VSEAVHRAVKRTAFIAALLLLLPIEFAAQAQTQGKHEPAAALAVIVHPDARLEELTVDRLRRIYKGEQQYWADGSRIILLMPPRGTPEREVILARVFGMSESEYKQFWVARIFRGQATSGPKVADRGTAQAVVAGMPAAVALIPATLVSGDVKVVRVNGALPGGTGYPLN
jgi:hypothetical protein